MWLLAKIKEKLPFSFGRAKDEAEVVPVVDKPVVKDTVIESAIKTDEEPVEKTLLEAAPTVDQDLLEEIEPPKSVLLYVLKGVFVLLVAVGIGSFLFFTSQLNSYLDFATNPLNVPSALSDLKSTNENVKEAQTDINLYRYLKGAIYLDNFSYYGDDYLKNYSLYANGSATDEERAAAKIEMDELKLNL